MTETIEVKLPVEDCYPNYWGDREPFIPDPEDRDETDEMIIEMRVEDKKREILREKALERLNEEDLPRATSLLWIDEAEVYSLCSSHYHEKRDGAWTGFTTHPDHDELRRMKQKQLREGRPCTDCKHERIKELMDEIESEVDIHVEVVE